MISIELVVPDSTTFLKFPTEKRKGWNFKNPVITVEKAMGLMDIISVSGTDE